MSDEEWPLYARVLFGFQPPRLKVRGGSVYLTDDLCAWVSENGASLGWIVYDKGKAMAGAYREVLRARAGLLVLLSRSDTDETRHLIACLGARSACEVTVEEAVARFRERVGAHRADV